MRNIHTQDSTSDFKRVNRGYMLREDLILDCKRIALEDGRKLYEVMEEALAEYVEHHKEGKAHAQGYQSAEF